MGEDDLLAHKECDWWGRGIPGPLTTAWIVATVAAVVLSACSPGAVAQTSSLASPPADLRQIAYDSATAGPVLEEGRAIFVQSLRPRHPIRWEES
ncbi:MAG: hypothetical protein HY684_04820, partial [Chloroflexi bacterium]|nr:hypothetical protein [Chloroflexota bacterium]